MEKTFNSLLRISIISVAVWATACSEVAFTPGEQITPFEVPDTEQKETFNFNDSGVKAKVDIMFVVDNSGSMLEEQNKLGAALSSFIDSLGLIDWQIGITTTDVSDGPYGIKGSLVPFTGTSSTVLNNRMPGYESLFMTTVVREELVTCKDTATVPCPSADERPLEAMLMAFTKKDTNNKGFFRAGADLAVVVLSDEDERSTGTGTGITTPAAVVAGFSGIFGTSKTLTTFGVIIEPNDSNCFNAQKATGGHYGTFAANLAALTDGETGSICDNDYGPTLASIGQKVKNIVKSITLKYTPDPATVRIVMTPFDSSITWEIIGNTIRFNKTPAKGTKVEVSYLPQK